MIRVALKFPAVVLIVTSFIGVGFVLGLTSRDKERVRRRRMRWLSLMSRPTLAVLGVKHELESTTALKDRAHFIISNHMSYIDIMVIASYFGASFITSKEVQSDPLLGSVCKAAGCHFVERRSFARLNDEIKNLALALDKGNSVALFPEATSSNGSEILPFKRALLNAAYQTKSKILPLSLSYTGANGREIGPTERDSIAYYGEMSFLPHIIRLLKLRSVEAKLVQLEPLALDQFPCSKELKQHAQEKIENAFEPMTASPSPAQASSVSAA